MSSYEVPEPILNSPFEKPKEYWYIQEGEQPELAAGETAPGYFSTPRSEGRMDGDRSFASVEGVSDGIRSGVG